jgi:hypothetical protein
MIVPGLTSDPAATSDIVPMRTSSSKIDPIPMRQPRST